MHDACNTGKLGFLLLCASTAGVDFIYVSSSFLPWLLFMRNKTQVYKFNTIVLKKKTSTWVILAKSSWLTQFSAPVVLPNISSREHFEINLFYLFDKSRFEKAISSILLFVGLHFFQTSKPLPIYTLFPWVTLPNKA